MVDTTRPTLATDRNDQPMPALPFDFANGQRLTVSGTSARSAAISTSTMIFLKSSTRCHVRIGDSTVTASAADGKSWPLAADESANFPITPGQYVAVVQDSAGGFLVVMPALAG